MSDLNQAMCEPEKWYHWSRCSLLPTLKTRKADRFNTASFNFHWLIFRAWTSDAPMLGFSVEFSDRDLSIRLNLPYLWTGLFIPIFPNNYRNRFWRRP